MTKNNQTTRRNFLKNTAYTAAALGVSTILPSIGCAGPHKKPHRHKQYPFIANNNTILFQGDSITDAGRDRNRENIPNDSNSLGKGYVFLIASQLIAKRPSSDLKIYNRGISGNKVFQLADRWDKDCLAVKPDILSILIGVNDLWHSLNGDYKGSVDKYEKDYNALIERTLGELPHVKLVICEPFILRCGAVKEEWLPEFDRYRAVAKKMADNFNAVFVPFQSMFDKAAKHSTPNHWSADGVHPSIAGCQLMANTWLKTIKYSHRS